MVVKEIKEVTKDVMKGSEYFKLAVLFLVLGVICIMGPISAVLYFFSSEGSTMTPAEQLGGLSYVIWPILGIGVFSNHKQHRSFSFRTLSSEQK